MILMHILLAMSWILYCFIHSLLANVQVKRLLQMRWSLSVDTYSWCYNIIAVILLALLVLFQVSVESIPLFPLTVPVRVTGIILIIVGGTVMFHSIYKYFRVLSNKTLHILQKSGIHRFVRHPLYSGTFMLIAGIFLCRPLLCNLVVASLIIGYTILGISLEEKKLISGFGNEYKQYQKQVPPIIPRLFARRRFIK